MSCLTILEYPDRRLRQRAEPVVAFDAGLARLIDDMFETMYQARGIGLAATQVNVHRQVVTLDVSGTASAPEVFINPRILARERVARVEESCLSLPGVSGLVKRPTVVRVRARDRHGLEQERELEGMLAVCLLHEVDHLAGRLFIDSFSFWKRLGLRRRFARPHRLPLAEGAAAASRRGAVIDQV